MEVQTSISNTTDEDAEIRVNYYVVDHNGDLAASGSGAGDQAQNNARANATLLVEGPRLWSTKSPYLYDFIAEIVKDGRVIDREVVKIGIRTFEFDADGGFFLNGEGMKIKGVCVHHDAGCLGAAVRKKVWERRLRILKEMGCNAIRMSHNPHMPELYDLCDSMGFLVMDEAFDEWEV